MMEISRRDLLFKGVGMAACAPIGAFGADPAKTETVEKEGAKMFFKLYPVGRVQKKDKSVTLQIYEKYADALKGLDDFSHVWVLYWFDRNDTPRKRGILQVYPRGNRENPLTGVFSCRSPVRPNLIALSLCRILSVKADVVQIDKIDAFDGTPILDLKPYIAGIDRPSKDVHFPNWLKK